MADPGRARRTVPQWDLGNWSVGITGCGGTMALLDELMVSWPPREDPPDSGYLRLPLAVATPVAATSLRSHGERGLAVVVARGEAGRLMLAPLVREGSGWRRARPRDGASAALVEAMASGLPLDDGFMLHRLGPVGHLRGERAMGVDQTNESIVVGGAIVVKWLAEPDLRPSSAADIQAHLAILGYEGVPRPLGSLVWIDGSGRRASLAFLNEWLPEARDGWDWCVQDLLAHLEHGAGGCEPDCPARAFPAELGRLTASLHIALATPSVIDPKPDARAGTKVIEGWVRGAIGALETARSLLREPLASELESREDQLAGSIRKLLAVPEIVVQRIHGDLHVGQVLSSPRGLSVIDLDDDISIPPDERGQPLSVTRDVAQMTCSLDHVGRVADGRTGGTMAPAIEAWIGDAQRDFQAAYRTILASAGRSESYDERLLEPFIAERICRELVYAAQVLPRWLYAPMATLRRVVPG